MIINYCCFKLLMFGVTDYIPFREACSLSSLKIRRTGFWNEGKGTFDLFIDGRVAQLCSRDHCSSGWGYSGVCKEAVCGERWYGDITKRLQDPGVRHSGLSLDGWQKHSFSFIMMALKSTWVILVRLMSSSFSAKKVQIRNKGRVNGIPSAQPWNLSFLPLHLIYVVNMVCLYYSTPCYSTMHLDSCRQDSRFATNKKSETLLSLAMRDYRWFCFCRFALLTKSPGLKHPSQGSRLWWLVDTVLQWPGSLALV